MRFVTDFGHLHKRFYRLRFNYQIRRRLPIGVITVGAFRAITLTDLAGISLGRSLTASRDKATPLVASVEIDKWAQEQASIINKLNIDDELKSDIAGDIRAFSKKTGMLPIAFSSNGWLTYDDIVIKYSWAEEIVIISNMTWTSSQYYYSGLRLLENVIVTETGCIASLDLFDDEYRKNDMGGWEFYRSTNVGGVVEALASFWDVNLDEVLKVSVFHEHEITSRYAQKDDGTFVEDKSLILIRKPIGTNTKKRHLTTA